MLTFLIATSVLNVLAGYALAVYVRGPSTAPANMGSIGRVSKLSLAKPERRSNAGGKAPAAGKDSLKAAVEAPSVGAETKSITSEQSVPASADAGATFKSTVEATMNRPIEEMERQLMAGIADFRNHLTTLRAESFAISAQTS